MINNNRVKLIIFFYGYPFGKQFRLAVQQSENQEE